jgi:TorA maturation chaperone TorD
MTATHATPVEPATTPVERKPSSRPADETELELVVSALDLLAHWWSRPDPNEYLAWQQAESIASRLYRHYSPERTAPAVFTRSVADLTELLDEYERLFVGPGPVPCPPYESFWRDDVPVEIRRSLMGPCTEDLRRLYGELGLQISPRAGELPDHIAVELEAMAYALSIDESGDLARQLFFDHVRRWLPRLCRAVGHETQHGVYRELAELSLEWLVPIEGYLAPQKKEAAQEQA